MTKGSTKVGTWQPIVTTSDNACFPVTESEITRFVMSGEFLRDRAAG